MPKKNENNKLTMSSIAKQFSDEVSAWEFLEATRWENGVVCPHCGTVDNALYLEPRNGARVTRTGKVSYRRVWQCGACNQQFSVLVGTIFEDSRIPLSKWLLGIHEMWADKNGISSCELARKLDITQKSAWHMAHRIRYAVTEQAPTEKLKGTIEVDETYIGGDSKNMHEWKREQKGIKQGRTDHKTPVVSIIERDGDVRSQKMTSVNNFAVRDVIRENVETGDSILMTDTSPVYPMVAKEFKAHETVNHSADEYARKTINGKAHVNTAEGYFSQLKRSIDGTHHHVSGKHLNRYLSEFDYRRNTRKSADGDRTLRAIGKTGGKRLTYKRLIGKKEIGGTV